MDAMPAHHKKHTAVLTSKILRLAQNRMSDRQFKSIEPFLRSYFAQAFPEDLEVLSAKTAFKIAEAHWQTAIQRQPGKALLRVYNPEPGTGASGPLYTVVEVVTDDMPFLVDSIRMEINHHGFNVNLMFHPLFQIKRNANGKLLGTAEAANPQKHIYSESFIRVEIERVLDESKLQALHTGLENVLLDVKRAVGDWRKMRKRLNEVITELEQSDGKSKDTAETVAFLQWLDDKNFTFLGAQDFEVIKTQGKKTLRATPRSALGILKNKSFGASAGYTFESTENRQQKTNNEQLLITKSVKQATVHRPGYMDYIMVRKLDSRGQIIGERRFVGLYTSTAYRRHPRDIPVVRTKIDKAFTLSKFDPVSHIGKAFLHVLETFPRDELLQIGQNELFTIAQGILHLGERQRLKLFIREDRLQRFVSCLVYVPRDRLDTSLRTKISDIILAAFQGSDLSYKIKLSEESFARIEYFVRTDPANFPAYETDKIEQALANESYSWQDRLRDLLLAQLPEADCTALLKTYYAAFPVSYQQDFEPETATHDIRTLETLNQTGDLSANFQTLEAAHQTSLKLYKAKEPIAPSDSLPILENMGFKVLQETPYKIILPEGDVLWIHNLILKAQFNSRNLDNRTTILQDVFAQVWQAQAENDGFNALALSAGLNAREISMLRAYCKYLLQTGLTFSQTYMEQCLIEHADIAKQLVNLFKLRFEPGTQKAANTSPADKLYKSIEQSLDAVASLDQDRILRNFLGVITATVRTNYYQLDADKNHKPYITFKFDTAKIPELPDPRPMFEIFVYSPRVEGVHLRSGKVARGGLRWSDRREDFRTEILGLVKAQRVKNAVIVPTGAKGGFYVKKPPAGGRENLMQEGITCYQQFISGLLDVSDNVKAGKVVPPKNVVRYDDDDPYIVVAADKGTATFSDYANDIALQYDLWLGDAFASGGSVGYDHKKMGITARGAWEAVKLHFRDLGTNIQSEDFTVVGIGDMSGDVFGNGMLLSRHTKLVAAFNHMHIFIDPNPNPQKSYKERQRLFKLSRSTWEDYDARLISKGGGIYSRRAKSIELSDQIRSWLNTQKKNVTPNELIQLLLKAPVDLLWNGGIGTYVKSSSELHTDAGDRSNDAVRVNANELRCKVIGEGGNLGLTQMARIEYALHGGRVDTDSIHNAGGVDCSDHEVNIKILLNQVMAKHKLSEKQRNTLLASMTNEVAELVLESNYWQSQAITLIEAEAPQLLDEHARYAHSLENNGQLNRALEGLPDDEQLLERKAASNGLTRPEISVLVSYAKIIAKDALVDSDLLDDPYFAAELLRYFPSLLRERYATEIHAHPLRREILATFIVNRMINRMGCTFVYRLQEETGATIADISRAYTIAWEVFNLREVWAKVAALDHKIPAQAQIEIMLQATKLTYRASRWLMQHRKRALGIKQAIADYSKGAKILSEHLPVMIETSEDAIVKDSIEKFLTQGVAKPLALTAISMDALYCSFDIVDISNNIGMPIHKVMSLYFKLSAYLDIFWLRVKIEQYNPDDQWQELACKSLIDDLYAVLRKLTVEVLRVSGKRKSPEEAIEMWAGHNRQAVDRCLKIPHDLKAAEHLNLAMFSVSLRELQNLYQASAAN